MPRDPHRVEIEDRVRVQHMLDAARAAVRFMVGHTREDLDSDELLARGLMHAIQEIGEAASRTSDLGRQRLAGLPWAQMVGMRHRLVHVYWGVNLDLVYEVVARDLPLLIASIEAGITDWPLPADGA